MLAPAFCPSDARAEDAADLFREGQEAYSNGDQQTAYEKYKAAWELKRSYDIAGNLGNVEVKLKKYKEAVPHLEFVLANLPVSMDSETRAAVMKRTQDLLNEAKSHVAIVKFSVTPPEASINVNGAPVEGGRVVVDPGNHTLSLSAEGYEPVQQTLELGAGAVENRIISMAKSGSGGTATIRTGTADSDSGGDDSPSIPILVAGGVLGLGALGAGIALHVVASGKGGERQDLADALPGDGFCSDNPGDQQCMDIDDLASQESTFSAAGTGLLVGGGVIVAATLTYWLWPRGGGDDASAGAVQLIPTVGPGLNGLTVVGTF